MKSGTLVQRLAFGLAAIGLCVPQIAMASDVKAPAAEIVRSLPPLPAVTDVVLQQGGTLVGQVVTAEKMVLSGVEVSISSANHKPIMSKTDQDGRFVFAGLTTGVYEVTVPGGSGVYRVWAPNTAPPAAKPVIHLVSQTNVVRGQNYSPTFKKMCSIPVLLAGLIATAIAVPVAIHNSGGKGYASDN